MNMRKIVSSDTMGNQLKDECTEHVGLSTCATHRDSRECLKGVWGEPTKMVHGSLWYYANNGEEYTVFMPFSERTPKSAVYDYIGKDGKVRIRRNQRRTSITIDCPNEMGVEAIGALWNAAPTREALEGAYKVERDENGVVNGNIQHS